MKNVKLTLTLALGLLAFSAVAFSSVGFSRQRTQRSIASVSVSSVSNKKISKRPPLDLLIQKNCETDLSEVELMAINSSELQGMMEKDEISDRQRKIEDSSKHDSLAGLAEECAQKIHKKSKVFVESSAVESKLAKFYKSKI